AAVNRVDKVLYIQKIQKLKDKESKNAEIALICGNIREAENILLQSGFILRAISLNLELFRWERALELALKYDKNNNFVELVHAFRHRYLERVGKKETVPAFRQLSNDTEFSEWSVYQERLDTAYEHRVVTQSKSTSKK
ncbi:unnamed protein product, partial [Medioppia subpectinata]